MAVKYLAGNVIETNDTEERESNLNQFPTNLRDYNKRKIITVNGAKKTADFTDDFTGTDDWTDGGTGFGVDTVDDELDVNASGDGTANISYYDMTSISDTAWVWDFDYKYTSSVGGGNGGEVWCLISDSNLGRNNAQDSIGVNLRLDNGSYNILDTLAGTPASGGDANQALTFVASTTYYFRVIRHSATKYSVTRYADSERTEVLDHNQGTCDVGTNGLRYIIFSDIDAVETGSSVGAIQKSVFYDGVTTVENIPSQQTVTFEDDFTTNAGWNQTGTLVTVDSGVADKLAFAVATNGSERRVQKDTSVNMNDSAWVVNFTYEWTASNIPAHCPLYFSSVSTNPVANTHDGIGVVQHSDGGGNYFTIGSKDGSSGFPTIDTSTKIDLTVSTTYYCTLIRESSTIVRLIVYSDSDRTVEVGNITEVITSSITGLTHVQSFTDSSGSATRHLSCTIDDLKIYNNITELNPTTLTDQVVPIRILNDTDLRRRVEPDYEDDFSTDKGWAEQGTQFTINAGTGDERIDFALKRDGASHEAYFDLQDADALGVGNNASDTAWCLRYHVKMTGNTSADAFNHTTYFGLYSSNGATTVPQDAIVNRITWGIDDTYSFRWEDNDDLNNSTGTDLSTAFTPTDDYYFEISRIDASSARIRVFNDSAYSILVEELAITGISNVTNLRYIGIKMRSSTTQTEVQNGWLDNVYFWDGITNPVTQETPTFEDDFTGAEDKWVDNHSANIGVNLTTNVIDFDMKRDGTNDATSFDLQQVLGKNADDEKWCLRWTVDYSAIYSGGNANRFYFGLSDSDESVGQNTAQDFIGLYKKHDATDTFGAIDSDGATIPANDTTTSAFATSTVYYCEVARLDRLNYVARIWTGGFNEVLFDESYGVCTATTDNLRYIKLLNQDFDSAGASSLIGTIGQVEFWNGTSSPNANARKFSFMDSTNTTEYSSETISYDPINGDYLGNVRIPSLTTGTDFDINMYYDYKGADYAPEPLDVEIPNSDSTLLQNTGGANSGIGWNQEEGGFGQRFRAGHSLIGRRIKSISFWIRYSTSNSSPAQNMYCRHYGSTPTTVRATATETPSTTTLTTGYVKTTFNFSSPQEIQEDDHIMLTIQTDGGAGAFQCEIEEADGDANTNFATWTDSGGSFTEQTNREIRYEIVTALYGDRESGVWKDNYKAVYHLQGNSLDSTVYGNDGTETSIDNWEENNNDVGVVLDGASDYIDLGGAVADWRFLTNEFYFETWLLPSTVSNNDVIFDCANVANSNNGMYLKFETTSSLRFGQAGATDTSMATGNIWNANELQHLAVRYDGVTGYIYRNGIEVARGSLTANDVNPTHVPRLGWGALGNDNKYDGYIGNLVINDKFKSKSSLITTYNAQKSDSDMLTVSGTETKRYEKLQTGVKVKQLVDNKEYHIVNDEFVEVI